MAIKKIVGHKLILKIHSKHITIRQRRRKNSCKMSMIFHSNNNKNNVKCVEKNKKNVFDN